MKNEKNETFSDKGKRLYNHSEEYIDLGELHRIRKLKNEIKWIDSKLSKLRLLHRINERMLIVMVGFASLVLGKTFLLSFTIFLLIFTIIDLIWEIRK